MTKGLCLVITIMILALGSGCGSPRYVCSDGRATYFDVGGKAIRAKDGISNGFVLIPAAGDAGSFMLGTYARVENGVIVEKYRSAPDLIRKNTFEPWYRERNASAQQVDAPEPATNADPASRPPLAPAR